MTRKTLVLATVVVLVGLCGVSESALFPRKEFRPTSLEELMESPKLYLGAGVSFTARYRQTEKDYRVFQALFTPREHVVFSVWPGDAKLWQFRERKKALPYLFVSKAGPMMRVVSGLSKYEKITVCGTVEAVAEGLPCIEVTDIKPVSDPALTDSIVRGFQLAVESVEANPKFAIDEFTKLLSGGLPLLFEGSAREYLGRCHFIREEYGAAVGCYGEAVRILGDRPQVLLWKGVAEYKAGMVGAAAESVGKCLALAPNDGFARSVMGVILGGQEKHEEAVAQCETAVELAARNPAVYWNYGEVMVGNGSYGKAAVALEKALELKKGDVEILKKLGDVYLVLKRVEDSLARFGKAVEIAPKDAEAHFGFGRAYLAAADSDKAKAEYVRAVALAPRVVSYHMALGMLQMRREEFQAAFKRFKKVLELDLVNVEANFRLGLIFERDSKWKDAERHFSEAVRLDPKHEMGYRHLAGCCKALDNVEKMTWAMEKIVQLRPKDHETRYLLGQVYRDRKMNEMAIAHLSICVRQQPENAGYHLALGLAQHFSNKLKEAEVSYRRTLELNPNSALACNNLAYMYLSQGRKDKEAVSLAKKAHELAPDNPAFLDTMGWAFYRQGKLEEAKEYIRAAYRAEAEPEVAYHLGMVLLDLGELEEAKRLLEESRKEKGTWFQDAGKMLRKIELLLRERARKAAKAGKKKAGKPVKKLVKPEEKAAPGRRSRKEVAPTREKTERGRTATRKETPVPAVKTVVEEDAKTKERGAKTLRTDLDFAPRKKDEGRRR